jgi:hypothetical protein
LFASFAGLEIAHLLTFAVCRLLAMYILQIPPENILRLWIGNEYQHAKERDNNLAPVAEMSTNNTHITNTTEKENLSLGVALQKPPTRSENAICDSKTSRERGGGADRPDRLSKFVRCSFLDRNICARQEDASASDPTPVGLKAV